MPVVVGIVLALLAMYLVLSLAFSGWVDRTPSTSVMTELDTRLDDPRVTGS